MEKFIKDICYSFRLCNALPIVKNIRKNVKKIHIDFIIIRFLDLPVSADCPINEQIDIRISCKLVLITFGGCGQVCPKYTK